MGSDLWKKANDKVIVKQVDLKGLNQQSLSRSNTTHSQQESLFFRASLQLVCRT